MEAKETMIRESKRAVWIYVGIVAICCLALAVGFTLAELKWVPADATSEYKSKMFWHIVKTYWIHSSIAPIVFYLILMITVKHFARMLDKLTPGEQLRYLDTFMHFPWYSRIHPGIVYSDRYIYASSFPTLFIKRTFEIKDIDFISCTYAKSAVVTVYRYSDDSTSFVCSKWDTLALYILYKQGKIPEIHGMVPVTAFEKRLSKKI